MVSSMYKKLNKVIMKHPKDAFINQEHLSNEWKKFNYIHEPDYIKAHQEFEQFLAIMKEHVAEIEFLRCNRNSWIRFSLCP